MGFCQARTGIGTFCARPTSNAGPLCEFHDSLAGPWSKPQQVFEKFSRE